MNRLLSLCLALAASALLLIGLLAGPRNTSVYAQQGDAPTPTPTTEPGPVFDIRILPTEGKISPPKYLNLDSDLNHIIEQAQTGRLNTRSAAANAPMHREESVAVTLYITEGYAQDVWDYLEQSGASPRNIGADHIEAYIPVSLLAEASEQEGVLSIRTIIPPHPDQGTIVGGGVAAHGVPSWHAAGYKGSGVKIGVIDFSFEGFAGLMGSELPATVNARCYTGHGSFTTILSDCITTNSPESSRKHGTAVTEAVFDIAPQAEYYIADPGTYDDLLSTVNWMVSQGVDVINMSLGWTFNGPGDGTTPYSNAPLKSVDAAVTGGIIWVNSAGNSAKDSWRGAFSDSDSDGIHQFNAAGNECNIVTIDLDPLEGFRAQLRWADSWGGASKNLDLYLIPVSGGTLSLSDAVATSERSQSGGGNDIPYETFSRSHGQIDNGEYCLAVNQSGGSAPSWIQLLVWGASGDLQNYVSARSIGNPAESRNSGMLAAGAARYSSTSTIESFSSQGPTTDNRTKPDIVGADGGTSSTYGTWYGTSQASPHVAGLAGLVKERFPSYSPSQIATYLKSNALARGTKPNNKWGHGFAKLPTLSTPVPLSTDATLSALTLSDVDFGTFSSGTESYTASVTYSVSQTTVTPAVNDSGASYVIKLDGVNDSDGTISLVVGSNVITSEVKAEDGDTTKTYRVTVTRAAASTDARLSGLTLSDVDFGTFSSGTESYTASVADTVPLTTVTPTLNDSEANFVIKLDGVIDSDGAIPLGLGQNVITIEVTAEDDTTTNTYTVTVTRALPPSTDATLKALTLSDVNIGAFSSGTTSYTASVANSVSRTTVMPTVNDSGATHVIKLGGVTDSDGIISLAVGSNVITVVVTAEDDIATGTYTVTVTRAAPPSSDATLKSLGLSNVSIGTFSSIITSYTASVANSVSQTTVTPTVNHSGATYVIKLDGVTDSDGVIPLSVGQNVITIQVTAEKGQTTGEYTVTVTRADPPSIDATLKTLTLSGVNFGAFSSDTTSYTASVANGVTHTTVTPTLNDSEAIYVVKLGGMTDADGTVSLTVGSNVITVEVTAEDGSTKRTYSVTVTRAAPVSTQGSVPDTPDQPVGTAVFVGGVDLEWNDVPGADSYDVQLFRNGQWADLPGDGVEITFYGAGAIISELDPGSTHWFQVRARNAHGSSDWSNFRQVGSTNQSALGKRARPDNAPASGAPVIDGTAQVGESLTADTTGIEDDNGLDRVQFRFQWVSNDGSADTDIASATDSTYTLAPNDEGKTIKVRVAFTDRGGYAESLTGVGTELVTSSAQANPAPTPEPAQNSPATGAPTISGTPQVGQTLTADTSGISDSDGLTNVTYGYQWVANDGTSDTDIAGATDSTYILVAADEGGTIKVQVSFTDDAANAESLTSAATATVDPAPNSPATGAPTISGTAQVGEILTADTSGIADTDGLANVSYSYQWIANDGTSDTAISGATNSTYTLVAADEGKTVKVRVSFTDDAGNDETLTSGATATVDPAPNSPATGAPGISGTAQVGETLTAATSGIADADGLANVSYGYQWIANDGTSDTAISGATNSTYTLIAADEGKTIKVRVSFTDDAGNDETLTSGATATVDAAPNSPATGAPGISGTAQVGETLTAATSGIADADGLTNVAYSYQWVANDGSTDTAISGATNSTYTLVAADEGGTIKVQVSFTDDADNDETLTSGATATVDAAPNSPATGAPTISGTAQVGETLTAATSGIADADGLANVAYGYQWIANDGTSDTAISGATNSTYTLVAADEGKTIKVRVSFTDAAGHGETLTSAATASVAARSDQGSTPDTPDHPVGTAVFVGGVDLEWNDVPGADSYDVQLFRNGQWMGLPGDGVEITFYGAGAIISELDPGSTHWFQVRARNAHGSSDWSNFRQVGSTNQSALGKRARPDNAPASGAPVIDGTAQVGESLTADTTGIEDGNGLDRVQFRLHWVSNDGSADAEITGATGSSYTLVAADEGKTVKVRVSFTDRGGYAESLTSAATDTVSFAVQQQVANNPATGAPAVNGNAQVGETLTADTSGIADADGLTNVSYSYQWIANDGTNDTDITGATDSGYILATADEGRTIKVKVSFTDDAGHGETLTSAATAAVDAAPNSPATGAPGITGTAQVGETLTAATSGIADADGLANVSYGYQWIANDGTSDTAISGATNSTYTLIAADEGKTIKVRVSFTDDAGHGETLTSAATGIVAAALLPLTVSLENNPATHNGTDVFTFEIRFSEEFPLSFRTLKVHALQVTGGTVKKARRVDNSSDIHWRITVRPDADGNVSIVLPVTDDCDDQGAICTRDGRKLSNGLEFTVVGPGG